ncbi:hypothetical protein GVAV_002674 [Gurleya vavrai]
MSSKKFYIQCSTILQKLLTSKSSLKTEVYKLPNPQRFFAILSQVLKNVDAYRQIISRMKFRMKNEAMCLIYVHEIINDNFEIKNKMTREILEIAKEYKFRGKEVIKYVRINILSEYFDKEEENNKKLISKKINISEEENIIEEENKILRDIDVNLNNVESKNFLKKLSIEGEETVLPFVYKITKQYNFYELECYNNGLIILQNISSCLPALILNPSKNSFVIDACSAPGNKTTHLCALMKNSGKIIAYEKDEKRFITLNKTIKKHNCTNIKTLNEDFLLSDIDQNADFILVDPSCSGSGVYDIYENDTERLENLSKFQKQILNHAFKYKNVKKIVYSTCSVNKEENEDVVTFVLEKNKDFELERIDRKYQLNENNKKFGYEDFVIRIEKDVDENVQGFFVASFVRKIE